MKNRLSCAFITGATSGIGLAIAEKLAAEGLDLVLTGRRTDRLTKVKAEFQQKYKIKVEVLAFDVCDRAATEQALMSLGERAKLVDVLVNNAGLALGTDSIPKANVDDWDVMIDTNIKGMLYLTRFFAPLFIASGRGHVVNLGSVAGRWVYSGGAVYCATKFAVRAISEGLRMDLFGTPVRVTNIEPGLVETEFSMVRFKDAQKAKDVYKGLEPLSAGDIADCVLWSLSRPAHINIQEMVVFPTAQAAIQMVHRT